jgi:hypothetical protein
MEAHSSDQLSELGPMKLIWGAATLAAMAGVVLVGLILTPLVAISDGLDVEFLMIA